MISPVTSASEDKNLTIIAQTSKVDKSRLSGPNNGCFWPFVLSSFHPETPEGRS
jgi:hypothetical protein